jgi:hypothetical protein
MTRATALTARRVKYAMQFVNGSEDEPTDEELERVLSGCVRAPHPDEYADIRLEVEAWRVCGLTRDELAELEDDREAWSITRGHLQRIAGRKLTDEEVAQAVKSIDYSEALDVASDAAAVALG